MSVVSTIKAPYEDVLRMVSETGEEKEDRTGVGTISIFDATIRFNLAEGFPLITTKRLFTKAIIEELLWMLRGESNIRSLQAAGVTIWDEWADENGELGPVYGVQWRAWPTRDGGTFDQIAWVINEIKTNPDSRRLIVSAWNASEVQYMALAPCHAFVQFYVLNGKLYCKVTQRSADMFLGVPFNLASYALLTHMIAQQCDLEVGDLVWSGGDVHIYRNHREQVAEQLSREPRPLPRLVIKRRPDSIDDYTRADFEFAGYDPHDRIIADVAV